MDKTPKQRLANLKEYKYLRNANRKKFLQAILIDGIAPTTAGTLIGVNSNRESKHPEVVACIAAFRDEVNPRQEIIDIWNEVFRLEGAPQNAAELDKVRPLPDPRVPSPAQEECERRYNEQKAAYEASKEGK